MLPSSLSETFCLLQREANASSIFINVRVKNQHQPQARHRYLLLWGQFWRIRASSKLTLAGKGCKTTPSSCRAVSTRWGYCLRPEPVSYMDMARPPRGGCRPKGPWSCCCPPGVCHRRVVFSVCRELSCGETKHLSRQLWLGVDLVTKAQPDINNRAENS